MLKNAILKTARGMSLAALMTVSALAQNGVAASAQPVNGIFVMPIPQSPFTVTVVGKSVRPLRDGTTEVLQTFNQIARDSSGRFYRGVRQMAPISLPGTSQLLYIHIYDPATRLSTILNPQQRIARQSVLKGPAPDWEQEPGPRRLQMFQAAGWEMLQSADGAKKAGLLYEDLGFQVMENVSVHGERISRMLPAYASGTGQPVVVTDEYWYSEELRLEMFYKHTDPRTGEITRTVTNLKREEPDPEMFKTPAGYKTVDETPEN